MATSDFNTPAKRSKLDPKAEPYWFKISKGRFIGYRRGKNGKRPAICIFFSSPQSTMMEAAFIIPAWRRAHGAVTEERRA